MKFIKIKILLAFAITITLLGCDNGPENPEQITFINKIKSLGSENSHLKWIYSQGKDDSGQIPSADISSQIENSDQGIRNFLKNSPSDVIQWNARVGGVQRNGNEIIIQSSYRSQYYYLKIFDNNSIKIAEKFIDGDMINFSGSLGPEVSKTLFGALSNQEFILYPTNVSSKHGDISQLPSEIKVKILQTQTKSAKQEKQKQKQNQEEDLKNSIIEICKNTLRSNMKYPESTSFSWFKQNLIRRSENEWTYHDTIEAKNDFGGTLPSRFECDASVLDGNIKVSIKMLDGTQ